MNATSQQSSKRTHEVKLTVIAVSHRRDQTSARTRMSEDILVQMTGILAEEGSMNSIEQAYDSCTTA